LTIGGTKTVSDWFGCQVFLKQDVISFSSLVKPIVKSLIVEPVDDLTTFINNITTSLLTNIALMPNAETTFY